MPDVIDEPKQTHRRWLGVSAAIATILLSLFLSGSRVGAIPSGQQATAANPRDAGFLSTTASALGLCPDKAADAETANFGLLNASAQTAASTADLTIADVAERANPAVVTITSSSQGFGVGTGSGFIIDDAGHVVTNNHVVQGADELSVQFLDGTEVPATVVGRDDVQDLAVIQLDLGEGVAVPGTLAFGDSAAIRPGDRVVAIGSALGEFTNTVSEGTVGAVERVLGGLPNLIQHDSEIWHGNSGGPLLSLQGEVIGVNVAGVESGNGLSELAPASIGFAIESNTAREIVDELIANGIVARPFLGIVGAPVDNGYQIVTVEPADGPAAEAGLQEGDVILGVEGTSLTRREPFSSLLYEHDPGDTITLQIERAGSERAVEVTLGQRPAATD